MGVEDQLESPIRGQVYISADVRCGVNWEKRNVVEIQLHLATNANRTDSTTVVVDRGTASKLINQLRRALDDSYNQSINERAGGSDDYA